VSALFDSFLLAGFECTTGRNMYGQWIDQVAATQHDRFADEDYAMVRAAGMRTARDGVRWPLVERDGAYDFASLEPLLRASRRHGVSVVWDLCHFGLPDGVDPFAPEFGERFAEFSLAAARYVAARTPGRPWFTPVNEPSYFAWAGGEVALFAPHARGRGAELKRALARAAILGIEAVRTACPDAGILNVDALCRVVAPADRPDLADAAARFNDTAVFEAWDMIGGRLAPELGGTPDALGVVGVNYYWTNQWELTRPEAPLPADHPEHCSLGRLVECVADRYGRDVLISETSHVGEARAVWMDEVAVEAEDMLSRGVPLRGVCIYPVLGMPEWHAPEDWARMGLWDLVPQSPTLARVPYEPMMAALGRAQRRLERAAA
jgi:hypothetical protein